MEWGAGPCVMAPSPKVQLPVAPDYAPPYWAQACQHLVKKDRVMRRLIPQIGSEALASRGDPFVTLARSIVGQQVSVKSAANIWKRLEALPSVMEPEHLLRLKVDDLRAAGLSARKVDYLVDLAIHFTEKRLHINAWPQMDDEAIISELMAIRGIGRWTAQMCLMFYLQRPNVLPLDDVALLKGISQCYFSGDPVSRSDAREVAEAWKPWATVATWYIWRSLDPQPVAY